MAIRRGAELDLDQRPRQVAEVVSEVIGSHDSPLRVRTSSWAEDLYRFKNSADSDGTQQCRDVVERRL